MKPVHPSRIAGFVLAFVALATCALATDFEVVVVEPLSSGGDSFEFLAPADLNQRGQVTGRACADVSCRPSRAFRYSPGTGVEDVGPAGAAVAYGERINDQGQVFGRVLNARLQKTGMFLWDDNAGLDPLSGLSRGERNFFLLGDLGADGTLVGGIFPPASGDTTRPVMYLPGEGWLDLSDAHPSFAEDGAMAWQLNARGDLVFRTSGPPAGDTLFARQEAWLARAGGAPSRLADLGTPTLVPGDLSDRGVMQGTAIDESEREIAFYFAPALGVVRIHDARFASSSPALPRGRTFGTAAETVSADGAVAGAAGRSRNGVHNRLFTYHPDEGLRVVARPRLFRRQMTRRGLRLGGVVTVGLSDRREQAGLILARNRDRSRFFFFSPESGLHDIQEILDAAGADVRVLDVHEINAAGQVLLSVGRRGARRLETAAILTPLPAER